MTKLEKLMKTLFLSRLYLYPRFKLCVSEALKADSTSDQEVVEVVQPMTEHMRAVQSAILVAMNSCLTELKKALPQLDSAFLSSLTLENSLFNHFDFQLRTQLEPEWHRVSPRTRQLVGDLSEIRKLLDYLLSYDAYTFYAYLLAFRAASSLQQSPSLW
jgi:DNA excision repair protein ERCC-4